MNDQERLAAFLDVLRSVDGLDQQRFDRLTAELERVADRAGYDEQGRLKVTLFDAKSYDTRSFEQQNNGRYAIRSTTASLNEATAHAAKGAKVVCIFVNDTCDEPVVKALASLGVELLALRCAGFNNVDLETYRQYNLSVVRVAAPDIVTLHVPLADDTAVILGLRAKIDL